MKIRKQLFPGRLRFSKYRRELEILEPIPLIRKEAVATLKCSVVILDQPDLRIQVLHGRSSFKRLRLRALPPIMQLLAVFMKGEYPNHKYLLNKCHLNLKSYLTPKSHFMIRCERTLKYLLHRSFHSIIQVLEILQRKLISHNHHLGHDTNHIHQHINIFIPDRQPPDNHGPMEIIKTLESVHQELNHGLQPPQQQ